LEQEPSSKDSPWWKRLWRWTGYHGKTLWDWQALLFVPVAIALIASLITLHQTLRQQEIEDRRAEADRKLEAQRAQAAQELETQRAQRAMVQAYLQDMGTFLLEKNLRTAGENSDVRLLARARTLAVLDGVSEDRKVRVLEFLSETELIQFVPPDKQPIISLRFADLRETHLIKRQILSSTDLDRAELNNAKLTGASLSNANLPKANLSGADLSDANLSGANLSGAILRNAKGLSCQQTEQAESLKDAIMPDGQKYEEWLKDKVSCGEDGEDSGPS
jgi:hypothetical protein